VKGYGREKDGNLQKIFLNARTGRKFAGGAQQITERIEEQGFYNSWIL
jgi:hypothetical protein